MAVKKRSRAIDMVKGLSIMTLFFLHFENGYFHFDYNYFIVRSPAFFIVVGWLWGMSSNNRTIKQHWSKRKQGLVKPYLWLSCVFLLFDLMTVLLKLQGSFILWRDLYKTLCLKGIGTLWFLPVLLGGEILFLKIRNLKPSIKISSYFICLILLYVVPIWGECNFIDNETVRNIIKAPVGVICDVINAFVYISVAFYAARLFGKNVMSQSRKLLFIEGLVILSISFILLNYNTPTFFDKLLFIIGNITAGFGILFFFTAIETYGIVAKPLEYFGKNSLIVMSFHFCILYQLALIFDRVIMGHNEYGGAITLVYFGVGVIAQIILIEVINRKFRFLIGK